MILEQQYLACLSQASYLVGDEESGVAAIVDPRRDVDEHLAAARRLGLTIRYTILTHFHADFVAGHLELAERTGAVICLGAHARADFPFRALRDGEQLELGPRVRLEVLETPGHTPESISLVVWDSSARRAVLTGDTLFVGDVGRPDLLASVGMSKDALARLLYRSLREKLLTLPDETIVYPGHGAGSMCGKSLGAENMSTIGGEKRTNYAVKAALQQDGEDAFVSLVTLGQSEPPAYFGWDAELNRRSHATLHASLAERLVPTTLDALLRQQNAGAQVLDVRDPEEWAPAHLARSINVGLDGRFAQWAGAVLDPRRPVLLVAPAGAEADAALRLGRIGFDGALAGFLAGGMQAVAARPDLVRRMERLAAPALARALADPAPPFLLDVRSPTEHGERRIEGAVNVPLPQLARRLDEVPRDRRVVIHCAGGYRSAVAASLLEQHGWTDVSDLDGGIAAWEEARLATVS